MGVLKSPLESRGGIDQVVAERAIAEVRAGRPLVLRHAGESRLMIGVESLDRRLIEAIQNLSPGGGRLLLPAPRLRHLGHSRTRPGAVSLASLDLPRIQALSFEDAVKYEAVVSDLDSLDLAALEMARIALVLPSVLMLCATREILEDDTLLRIDATVIHEYRASSLRQLAIISRAPVPLEDAPDSEFVVFRGGDGLRDQLAILVGNPDVSRPVTVRLHSACLTGDLFSSLKCDCGDQLRRAVRYLSENGGGALLYLDQEGRGNGLSNKIRAYGLQARGFDTYDADETLGFEHDQRRFDFAAAMLTQLGINRVNLMTNNPLKVAALEAGAIEVVSAQRILGRTNDHNARYLAAKRDRAGHYIDLEEATVNAASKD